MCVSQRSFSVQPFVPEWQCCFSSLHGSWEPLLLVGASNSCAEVRAACIFAIACALWWISYRVCRSVNGQGMTLGFLTLGLWMLHLVGALFFDFHRYVADLFFWTSTAIFLLLIILVALSDPPSIHPKASPSLD